STAPDGGIDNYELETIHLDVTATDPAAQPINLALMGAPDGGILTNPSAAKVHMDWIPTFTDAQLYNMVANAQSTTDASRTAMLPIPMRIRNAVDPVFRLNPNDTMSFNQPPTVIVGDLDGDGFADLASCAVAATA